MVKEIRKRENLKKKEDGAEQVPRYLTLEQYRNLKTECNMAKGMRCPECKTPMYGRDEKYLERGMYVTYECPKCGFDLRRYEDYD